MNKRSKKPPVTPADGPCPKGKEAFLVSVTESYEKQYVVYAEDRCDAEEIVQDMLSRGEVNPTEDSLSAYDCETSAEEYELRVTDLEPDGHLKWKGRRYPYWTLRSGERSAVVADLGLQKELVSEDGKYLSPRGKSRKLDESVAFYVGPEDTVKDVKEVVFG